MSLIKERVGEDLKEEDLKKQLLIYAEGIRKTSDLMGKNVIIEKLGTSLIIAIHGLNEED